MKKLLLLLSLVLIGISTSSAAAENPIDLQSLVNSGNLNTKNINSVISKDIKCYDNELCQYRYDNKDFIFSFQNNRLDKISIKGDFTNYNSMLLSLGLNRKKPMAKRKGKCSKNPKNKKSCVTEVWINKYKGIKKILAVYKNPEDRSKNSKISYTEIDFYYNPASYTQLDDEFLSGVINFPPETVLTLMQKSFLIDSASNSDVAQFALSNAYFKGSLGFERNSRKGLEFLFMSAENGNVLANFTLGSSYLTGTGMHIGIKRNIENALQYLTFAASESYPDALFLLGQMYLKIIPTSVQKDFARGFSMFEASAKLGSEELPKIVAILYSTKGNKITPQDLSKAYTFAMLYKYKETDIKIKELIKYIRTQLTAEEIKQATALTLEYYLEIERLQNQKEREEMGLNW